MATNFRNYGEESPYRATFDPDKNYIKVLYNPGKALQARELIDSQTYLNYQLASFGGYFFKDGTPFGGGIISYTRMNDAIRLDAKTFTYYGISTTKDKEVLLNDYIGKIFNNINTTKNIQITGWYADPINCYDNSDENYYLIFSYLGDELNLAKDGYEFTEVSTIETDETALKFIVKASTDTNPNPMKALTASCTEGTLFIDGYFVHIKQQECFLSLIYHDSTKGTDYSTDYIRVNNPDENDVNVLYLDVLYSEAVFYIGYEIDRTIISAYEDNELYDNATGTYNYKAPGANRQQIQVTLTGYYEFKRKIYSTADNTVIVNYQEISNKPAKYSDQDTSKDVSFVTGIVIKNDNTIQEQVTDTNADMMDLLAKRTYEESGSYTVNPWKIQLKSLNSEENTDAYLIEISSGLGYIYGYRNNTSVSTLLENTKPREYNIKENNIISTPNNIITVYASETENTSSAYSMCKGTVLDGNNFMIYKNFNTIKFMSGLYGTGDEVLIKNNIQYKDMYINDDLSNYGKLSINNNWYKYAVTYYDDLNSIRDVYLPTTSSTPATVSATISTTSDKTFIKYNITYIHPLNINNNTTVEKNNNVYNIYVDIPTTVTLPDASTKTYTVDGIDPYTLAPKNTTYTINGNQIIVSLDHDVITADVSGTKTLFDLRMTLKDSDEILAVPIAWSIDDTTETSFNMTSDGNPYLSDGDIILSQTQNITIGEFNVKEIVDGDTTTTLYTSYYNDKGEKITLQHWTNVTLKNATIKLPKNDDNSITGTISYGENKSNVIIYKNYIDTSGETEKFYALTNATITEAELDVEKNKDNKTITIKIISGKLESGTCYVARVLMNATGVGESPFCIKNNVLTSLSSIPIQNIYPSLLDQNVSSISFGTGINNLTATDLYYKNYEKQDLVIKDSSSFIIEKLYSDFSKTTPKELGSLYNIFCDDYGNFLSNVQNRNVYFDNDYYLNIKSSRIKTYSITKEEKTTQYTYYVPVVDEVGKLEINDNKTVFGLINTYAIVNSEKECYYGKDSDSTGTGTKIYLGYKHGVVEELFTELDASCLNCSREDKDDAKVLIQLVTKYKEEEQYSDYQFENYLVEGNIEDLENNPSSTTKKYYTYDKNSSPIYLIVVNQIKISGVEIKNVKLDCVLSSTENSYLSLEKLQYKIENSILRFLKESSGNSEIDYEILYDISFYMFKLSANIEQVNDKIKISGTMWETPLTHIYQTVINYEDKDIKGKEKDPSYRREYKMVNLSNNYTVNMDTPYNNDKKVLDTNIDYHLIKTIIEEPNSYKIEPQYTNFIEKYKTATFNDYSLGLPYFPFITLNNIFECQENDNHLFRSGIYENSSLSNEILYRTKEFLQYNSGRYDEPEDLYTITNSLKQDNDRYIIYPKTTGTILTSNNSILALVEFYYKNEDTGIYEKGIDPSPVKFTDYQIRYYTDGTWTIKNNSTPPISNSNIMYQTNVEYKILFAQINSGVYQIDSFIMKKDNNLNYTYSLSNLSYNFSFIISYKKPVDYESSSITYEDISKGVLPIYAFVSNYEVVYDDDKNFEISDNKLFLIYKGSLLKETEKNTSLLSNNTIYYNPNSTYTIFNVYKVSGDFYGRIKYYSNLYNKEIVTEYIENSLYVGYNCTDISSITNGQITDVNNFIEIESLKYGLLTTKVANFIIKSVLYTTEGNIDIIDEGVINSYRAKILGISRESGNVMIYLANMDNILPVFNSARSIIGYDSTNKIYGVVNLLLDDKSTPVISNNTSCLIYDTGHKMVLPYTKKDNGQYNYDDPSISNISIIYDYTTKMQSTSDQSTVLIEIGETNKYKDVLTTSYNLIYVYYIGTDETKNHLDLHDLVLNFDSSKNITISYAGGINKTFAKGEYQACIRGELSGLSKKNKIATIQTANFDVKIATSKTGSDEYEFNSNCKSYYAYNLAKLVITDVDIIKLLSIVVSINDASVDITKTYNVKETDTSIQAILERLAPTLYAMLTFNNGQTPYMYDYGNIIGFDNVVDLIKTDCSLSSGTIDITIKYGYWKHKSKDVTHQIPYTCASYVYSTDDVTQQSDYAEIFADNPTDMYANIPTYTYNNKEYTLRDCIDFRPDINNTYEAGYAFPLPNTQMKFNVGYYLSRIDAVWIASSGGFGITQGLSSDDPQKPSPIDKTMILYYLYNKAYVTDISDITLEYVNNQRYTMADINTLDNRITKIENTLALSYLEQSAINTQITQTDSTGSYTAYKTGIFADNYSNYDKCNTNNEEWNASLDAIDNSVRSDFDLKHFDFVLQDDTYEYLIKTSSDAMIVYEIVKNSAYVRMGLCGATNIKYSDTYKCMLFSETVKIQTLNQRCYHGYVKLSKTSSSWFDYDSIVKDSTPSKQGIMYNSWVDTSLYENNTEDSSTVLSNVTNYNCSINTNEIKEMETQNSFMVQEKIDFELSGFKPSTIFYISLDNNKLSDSYKTDTLGNYTGSFTIPAKISTGEKLLVFYSEDNSSFATVVYNANGITGYKKYTSLYLRNTTEVSNNVIKLDNYNSGIQTSNVAYNLTSQDLLAETFVVKETNGIVIQSILLYFATKDTSSSNAGIGLYIVECENGYPGTTKVPFSDAYVMGSDVSKKEDGTIADNTIETIKTTHETPTYTEFKFSCPVYLSGNKEYAFVIYANSPDYTIYTSTLNNEDIVTLSLISKQPYAGTMYRKSNDGNWISYVNTDIAFQIKQYVFQTNKDYLFCFDLLDGSDKYNQFRVAEETFKVEYIQPLGTSIDFKYSLNNGDIYNSFVNKKYISNTDEKIIVYTSDKGNNTSVKICVTISTTDENVSPILDLEQIYGIFTHNNIRVNTDNGEYDYDYYNKKTDSLYTKKYEINSFSYDYHTCTYVTNNLNIEQTSYSNRVILDVLKSNSSEIAMYYKTDNYTKFSAQYLLDHTSDNITPYTSYIKEVVKYATENYDYNVFYALILRSFDTRLYPYYVLYNASCIDNNGNYISNDSYIANVSCNIISCDTNVSVSKNTDGTYTFTNNTLYMSNITNEDVFNRYTSVNPELFRIYLFPIKPISYNSTTDKFLEKTSLSSFKGIFIPSYEYLINYISEFEDTDKTIYCLYNNKVWEYIGDFDDIINTFPSSISKAWKAIYGVALDSNISYEDNSIWKPMELVDNNQDTKYYSDITSTAINNTPTTSYTELQYSPVYENSDANGFNSFIVKCEMYSNSKIELPKIKNIRVITTV